jgi:predicted MPP superfamily phosphohydrolase
MVFKVVLFLAAILALTIGAHLLFFKAVVSLFLITSPGLKISLFVLLFLLSLSFMVSFLLLRWQANTLTVGFYMFSAVWFGLFINLLLAILLSWLIIAAVWIAGTYHNTRLIAAGCLTLAVLFSAYGMWNAFHPRIKKLPVEIENLPEQWKGKIIVQLSDVHLGHFYGPKFLAELVQRVNALQPALIFITGDLFDGMASDISRFTDGLNRFKAEKGVYFVTGNHENYIGLNRALKVLAQTRINVLRNEGVETDGLQIIGVGYPGIEGTKEIQGLDQLEKPSSIRKPRILLFHTPTNMIPTGGDGLDRHFSTYWVPETTFSPAQQLRVDLQLSGHTHAGQIFPFGFLTRLLYKGYDYGLRHLGAFSLYTTSGVGTWGPPMRTGNRPEIVVINLL